MLCSCLFFQVTKKLKDKEIKRQEHIYEFILTEKHHCLTLRVMQKVWAKPQLYVINCEAPVCERVWLKKQSV